MISELDVKFVPSKLLELLGKILMTGNEYYFLLKNNFGQYFALKTKW